MNNDKISSWTRIIVEIGILLFAVGIAWATLNGDVKSNKEKIYLDGKRISTCEEAISVIKVDIRELKVGQNYIIKSVDEIKEGLKVRQDYGK